MAITGYLAEFSLAEIFQFLEQSHKTGLLTIRGGTDRCPSLTQGHYIWFRQGEIVAASHETGGQGLCHLINRRGWLGYRAALRLSESCPPGTPLGLYLKSQNILGADQLKLLFYTQVMQQVCSLFALEDGSFHFNSRVTIPSTELTGLSAPAMEVTLAGLRVLRDWSALADKLPDAHSSLINTTRGRPTLRLKSTEWQIWEFADGHTPIHKIAHRLNLPIEKVRQIAFRLIVVGLMEELPLLGENLSVESTESPQLETLPSVSEPVPQVQENELSHSFLQSLVGFLTGRN